ncbi:GNAT family N-acetyltransferase [Chryseobacterium geocarposphaerae]|uniref:Putative acetyltransferase n=1 Tax=Chryseobacterium geocarposphaerae TaxID=1416776 RepID=A0A2M9C6N6_9FLAO|nr:GNAT family N-acetyltransferase [Chryseobacterium geocarposphaerae]PJJ66464.1 putative acetyltransferase [Chryseobacterium geocarposphaerae]
MSIQIRLATTGDYPRIMEIWESAVRATHDFLLEEDLSFFKHAIPKDYLPNLEVYLFILQNQPVAFASVSEGSLEMLFVHNDYRGKGYGKSLFQFMDETKGITKVDVNEQNYQAVGFYEKLGFRKAGRSEKDGSGKDYPIIHMLR